MKSNQKKAAGVVIPRVGADAMAALIARGAPKHDSRVRRQRTRQTARAAALKDWR